MPRSRTTPSGVALSLAMSFVLLLIARPEAHAAATAVDPSENYLLDGSVRRFAVTYVAHVPELPANATQVRVWIPVPEDSAVQTIRQLEFSIAPRLTRETEHGNRIAYWEFADSAAVDQLTMQFVCERREVRTDLQAAATDGNQISVAYARFLQPDRLGGIDSALAQLAAQVTTGRTTTLTQARAIYDYVVDHMVYDKSQPGWGTGSTRFACETGRGNCTDFHALFMSLCRARGIACQFEIGLFLPYEPGVTEAAGGYHCWAWFRIPGRTWVPVDCSEASRHDERRAYLFGNHTNNRVTLSVGRDIVLEPRQAGEPLNYFLDPYVEVDGAPVAADKTWSFHDLD